MTSLTLNDHISFISALNQCCITKDDLKGKPPISKVIDNFLEWIDKMVLLANEKNKAKYFPGNFI